MPVAISADSVWDYQLVCDRVPHADGKLDEKCRASRTGTFFRLAPLSPRVEANIEDSFITLGAGPAGRGLVVSGARLGERSIEILSRALRGWTNFNDEAGLPVPFDPKDIEANIARIAPEHRHEIAAAVMGRTRVTLAESD